MKLFPFTKTYDGLRVLDFPGLELEPGKIYGVIGANGSGKSTFARILGGTLKADRISRYHDGGRVGYMPQKTYAFRMTTLDNILLNGSDREKARELMAAMGISHLAEKSAHRLSGGETARMALARLMMGRYDLVVLDEPTAAMDMEATALAEKLIADYVRDTGCTLILVTHSLPQAQRIAQKVLFFHRGVLAEYGRKEQLLTNPADQRTRRFLEFCGL